MSSIAERIPRWWRQPDHFEWFSHYLQSRGMAVRMRVVMVAVTAALAVMTLALLVSSAPPRGTVGTVLAGLSGVGAAAAALLWVVRFPTRRQSIAFAVVSSASIAMAATAQSNPFVGIIACTAFASLSGYLALFHSAPLMAANLLVALGISVPPALALVDTHGVVLAACAYAAVLVGNVAVPCVVQVIVHTLGVDVLRADLDPLTGLYTRRAFHHRALSMVANSDGNGHLVMAMVDLDKFKLLNDTHGHAEGDRVLTAVGRTLRDMTRQGAIVGRLGGEEFLVAEIVNDPRPDLFGQRLCAAVAALPHQITASIGTAIVPCKGLPQRHGFGPVIAALTGAADAAMYTAKRNGGNQSCHHRAAPPTPSPDRVWNAVDMRWERTGADVVARERRRIAPPPTAPVREQTAILPAPAPAVSAPPAPREVPQERDPVTMPVPRPRSKVPVLAG